MSKTLYVCHSGQTLDLPAIEDLFTTVGDVEKSQFVTTTNSTNAAKVGAIEMATTQQALDCAERFNGHSMNGHVLSVDTKRPKEFNCSRVKRSRSKWQ
jgi:riboflavin synthase alpha subunit